MLRICCRTGSSGRYRVRFEESTADETMRTAVFLAWAADSPGSIRRCSASAGTGTRTRGLFWLVRAIRLDVLGPIRTYDDVYVSTQVIGYRRIAARRHSEVRSAGRPIARARSRSTGS